MTQLDKQPEILSGAEEFSIGDGPVGALLIHGFTGSPQGMRRLGMFLADHGLAVEAPRLPGHGTTWQDLNGRLSSEWAETAAGAFQALKKRCDEVFVVGLSFGVAVGIDVIANHPGEVAGLVGLASFVWSSNPLGRFAPAISKVVKSLPGVANDIAEPGSQEIAYKRLPTVAAAQMLAFCATARDELGEVKVPTLLIHSRNDHTASPRNVELIRKGLGTDRVEVVWLERSYHVITLDYDRHDVFARTLAFVKSNSIYAF